MSSLCTGVLDRTVARRALLAVVGVEASERGVGEAVMFGDVAEAVCAEAGVRKLLECMEEECDLEESLVHEQEVLERTNRRKGRGGAHRRR